jgi:predicted acetyltransferase
MVDREATGNPMTLLDGTRVPRIPGYRRWMWDGEFCGSIGFRWQPGTEALPHVDLTADPDNVPSQRVIEANGGVFIEEFITPPGLGSKRERRFRIRLDDAMGG